MRRALLALERALARGELALAIGAFVAMLALSLADIAGRNLLHATVPQGDLILRQLVLWVALPGALLAVVGGRHLALDPANLAARPGWERWTRLPFNLAAAAVCALLAQAAWRYWRDEWALRNPGADWLVGMGAILPAAFALLALHFTLRAAIRP